MNLIKPEENTKESLGTQLIISVFGISAGSAIGDPTGISAATASVIAKWGLDRLITPLMIIHTIHMPTHCTKEKKIIFYKHIEEIPK